MLKFTPIHIYNVPNNEEHIRLKIPNENYQIKDVIFIDCDNDIKIACIVSEIQYMYLDSVFQKIIICDFNNFID